MQCASLVYVQLIGTYSEVGERLRLSELKGESTSSEAMLNYLSWTVFAYTRNCKKKVSSLNEVIKLLLQGSKASHIAASQKMCFFVGDCDYLASFWSAVHIPRMKVQPCDNKKSSLFGMDMCSSQHSRIRLHLCSSPARPGPFKIGPATSREKDIVIRNSYEL